MVILEAIASGLPVIYCDDNLVEGLTPQNSKLTASIDAVGFATAIEDLLSNPAGLKSMSKASSKVAKDFDISSLALRLTEIYKTAEPPA